MIDTPLFSPLSLRLITMIGMFGIAATVRGAPNLVPDQPAEAANYWCTWYAQNYWQQRPGEITDFSQLNNPNAREEISDHHLFNATDGWATNYLRRGREDFFFLIDHGWQTKEPTERTIEGDADFFSLQIDPRDFPSIAHLPPAAGLRAFNERIKSLGWRGLGLWVRGNVTPEAARTFVEWSRDADIKYWKIDGGDTKAFYSYHAKQEIFPELQLEYINGTGPFNEHWDDPDRASYPSPFAPGQAKQASMLQILKHTDIFRTYDVAPLLYSTITMQRVHDILQQTQNTPAYIGILNIQDDPQVAAGMGCLIASKRHPNFGERTMNGEDFHHQMRGKRMVQWRMNEVERFGRWQRIAPAFAAGVGTYQASNESLVDRYPHTERDTWFKSVYGSTVAQSAPAIMSRNMPLPLVNVTGEAPYVMASTYPNGPVCVATEGRVSPDNQWYEPRADVTIKVANPDQPIGVFGHYDSLTLEFDQPIDEVTHIWAQDLLADKAIDIRSHVHLTGNQITIPGQIIDQIGTAAADVGDISVPGLVIQIAP